jgi:hypothetical protein
MGINLAHNSMTGDERYAKLAGLYAEHFIFHNPYPAWALHDAQIWFPLEGI